MNWRKMERHEGKLGRKKKTRGGENKAEDVKRGQTDMNQTSIQVRWNKIQINSYFHLLLLLNISS